MRTSTTVTCDTCGTSLTRTRQTDGSQPRARYCSNACRQRSYRLRQKSGGIQAGLDGEPLTQLSSLVGRAEELVELKRLLHESRLLTVTGPAGAGKSRLAMEVAGQEARGRRSAVSVVRLGTIEDPGAVRQRIIEALADKHDGGPADSPPPDRLLVLDDCDPVLFTCGALLTELLPERPRLRVLATSREPLRLPGELVYSVSGLALSDPETVSSPADHLRSDAVALFVDRARAVSPAFRLYWDNASDVAEVCARLDGLPLPIEMAAQLIRVFPPAEIRSRLHDRLSLLTNGWRLAEQRHQSLRASLEWGYALLSPVEQTLLRRLSVLPGGFGPDAVAAVTADVPEAGRSLARLLVTLESKSLITPMEITQRGASRFRMLESTQHFARDLLVAEHEDASVHEQLISWLTTLSLPLRNEGVVRAATLDRLAEERVNLVHALGRLADGHDERQLLLAGALAAVEGAHGQGRDVALLVEHALEQTAPDSPYRSVALEAAALDGLCAEPDEAAKRIDQAVREEQGHGRTPMLGRLLLLRGTLRHMRDESRASVDDLEESLEIGQQTHHDTLVALSRGALARHRLESGDTAGAERELQRSLPVLREGMAPQWLSGVLSTAGSLALEKGEVKRAEEDFSEALRCRAHHHADAARALEGLALAAVRGYRYDRGVRLLGVAEGVRSYGHKENDWWRRRVQAARDTALRALPLGRAESWLEAGRTLPWPQALSLALDDASAQTRAGAEAAHPLSRRERDVAALVVEGLTNRQIAARIHVSVRTVETHVRHIRTTLGLRSRAHIAAWAVQQLTGSPEGPAGAAPGPFSAAEPPRRLPDPRDMLRGVRMGGGAALPRMRDA
ncbi:ATP-binding protein [Streptomyces sp. S584]|uniref:ATP-binding protein n=1 Tax=Streptomyces sp. S584 TaxID=3096010 RepID=UPI002AFF2519|nr:LuxR C-terminal-related transcriptional regulator [Streptomyces sp. S584]